MTTGGPLPQGSRTSDARDVGAAVRSASAGTRTPATVTDRDVLLGQLEVVRRAGYAVTIDELELGLAAIAAPVHGGEGRVIAALGVSGPTARLQDRVDQVGRLLIEQADRLAALLRRTHKEGAA
jgi:DNA-binding IclR family transcriptional regulator